MPLYPFETQLVVDGDNPNLVLTNASVTFYNPTDTNHVTPLTLVDAAGIPLANPVLVGPSGFCPAFQATIPQVMWVGGAYSGYMNSFQGVLNAALAAQAAAEAAAANTSGGLPAGEDGQWLGNTLGTPTWKELVIPSSGSGKVDFVIQDVVTGVIPARPTSDTNILVLWICWTEPNRVTSGTSGAHPKDLWIKRVAP